MRIYYFDYNASTPVVGQVRQAMEPFFTEHFANPSSLHQLGRIPSRAMRDARRQMAALVGAVDENEVIFTSGGTESNNAAIRSALALSGKKRVITTAVEHSSVRKLCKQLRKEGYEIVEIGVDDQCRLDLDQLRESLTDETAVVSLMMANNETGVIFPVEEVAAWIKAKGIFFHVDAVQVPGKLSLHMKETQIDFLSLSAHKFYGPKGVGILYAKKGTAFQPLIFGGAQERGRRAGTENVPGIVGTGVAAELIMKDMQTEVLRMRVLRDEFEKRISREISEINISGFSAPRVCNTSHVRFLNVDGEALLISLDQKGICASSGSACLSGSREA